MKLPLAASGAGTRKEEADNLLESPALAPLRDNLAVDYFAFAESLDVAPKGPNLSGRETNPALALAQLRQKTAVDPYDYVMIISDGRVTEGENLADAAPSEAVTPSASTPQGKPTYTRIGSYANLDSFAKSLSAASQTVPAERHMHSMHSYFLRPGDTVRVEDFVGTVENIGMRSTRFRTPDRTLITIPNGKLSDMRTETFAARDRIRFFTNLGLTYATTAAQLREVVAGIEGALRSHPKVFPEGIGVRFSAFQESALNVEVMAYFQTLDWDEFSAIRTELFLRFMEIVERAGTSLAFPTRTVHLVSHQRAGERAG